MYRIPIMERRLFIPDDWPSYLPAPTRLFKDSIAVSALIDDEGLFLVAPHLWRLHPDGYAFCSRQCPNTTKQHLMHRLIMGILNQRESVADHINFDRLDNRRSNLRVVTQAENLQNRRSYKGSTSRFRGVNWRKSHRKWQARGRINNKENHLGYFDDEEEAAEVARLWRRENMPFSTEVL